LVLQNADYGVVVDDAHDLNDKLQEREDFD